MLGPHRRTGRRFPCAVALACTLLSQPAAGAEAPPIEDRLIPAVDDWVTAPEGDPAYGDSGPLPLSDMFRDLGWPEDQRASAADLDVPAYIRYFDAPDGTSWASVVGIDLSSLQPDNLDNFRAGAMSSLAFPRGTEIILLEDHDGPLAGLVAHETANPYGGPVVTTGFASDTAVVMLAVAGPTPPLDVLERMALHQGELTPPLDDARAGSDAAGPDDEEPSIAYRVGQVTGILLLVVVPGGILLMINRRRRKARAPAPAIWGPPGPGDAPPPPTNALWGQPPPPHRAPRPDQRLPTGGHLLEPSPSTADHRLCPRIHNTAI